MQIVSDSIIERMGHILGRNVWGESANKTLTDLLDLIDLYKNQETLLLERIKKLESKKVIKKYDYQEFHEVKKAPAYSDVDDQY